MVQSLDGPEHQQIEIKCWDKLTPPPSIDILAELNGLETELMGDPEVTANLYRYFAYTYWEGCVICSIYLR